MATTILRGFKVSSAALDLFLEANGVPRLYSSAPFADSHPDDFPSKLLFNKIISHDPNADKNRFRVLMPSFNGWHEQSKVAFVSYVWTVVKFYRELDVDKDLPPEVPKGFEELRQEILSFEKDVVSEQDKVKDSGKISLYLVVNDEPTYSGMYPVEEY
ncbi:hypothetical protein QBC43DRAFT_319827 [Cladorrhinum sp. PSN259]|nr:hypothetical protein QBC43DRAFT_319827 [Cladorrhinum sp. PSN259]